MVEITPAAAVEIERIKLNRQMSDAYLRLAVKPGGCLDLFYDLSFESEIQTDSSAPQQGDRLLQVNGICLIIDPQSWQYVESLKLDYGEDLMGGGFRFHNPQSKKNCGCGISFLKSS